MRDFIKEQIEKYAKQEIVKEGQVNELDLSSAINKLKGLVTSKNSQMNRDFAELIADKFDGEFGKYLRKRLIRSGKSVNTIGLVLKYLRSPSDSSYENVFELIGIPMLDYFVNKSFGKIGLGARMRRMTPFMKKVSTGNKQLDAIIFKGLADVLEKKEVRKKLKDKLKRTIDTQLSDVISDQDFWDFINDYEDNTNESVEKINEIGISDKLRGMFGSRETRNKFKIVDNILRYIPNLKRRLKRELKEALFDMDYEDIDHMVNKLDTKLAGKLISKPIMRDIVKNARGLYFKEEYFSEFNDMVEEVFLDNEVLEVVSERISKYMKYVFKKARQQRKQLAAKKRR